MPGGVECGLTQLAHFINAKESFIPVLNLKISFELSRIRQSKVSYPMAMSHNFLLLFTPTLLLVLAATTSAGTNSILATYEHFRIQRQYLNLFHANPSPPSAAIPAFQIDTEEIDSLVPKDAFFGIFNLDHGSAVHKVIQLLQGEPDLNRALELAQYLRSLENVHTLVWYYAVTSWSVADPRLQAIPKPSPVDMMPSRFINAEALKRAKEIRADECVVVDGRAGVDNGRENDLWYWREDLMNNAFHFFYHMYYYADKIRSDRRSETFYLIHHDVIARYNAERFALRLPRSTSFVWELGSIIEEGYYPHLNDTMTSRQWGGRDPNTSLPYYVYPTATIDQQLLTQSRIYDAINTGNLLLPNGSLLPIDNARGTDLLGDIIEGNPFSVNNGYYAAALPIHGTGHQGIGRAERPLNEPREPAGVMMDIAVSFRDPTFYQWHSYINDLFDANKRRLRPYTPTGGELPLVWSGVSVTDVGVQASADSATTNKLFTFFNERRMQLSGGLDHRGDFEEGEVDVCVKHLDHENFVYKVVVNSDNVLTRPATVRIFLVPKEDENDHRLTISDQRDLIFTMDVFQTTLQPGENVIYRPSGASTVTIPWHQTLKELENGTDASLCGCGFPQHLNIPRGRPEGMAFDLVVMVTNFVHDAVDYEEPPCRSAYVYCGLPSTKYPDAKPMGYPFDRLPFHVDGDGNPVENGTPVQDLDEYLRHIPNMAMTQVTITHLGERANSGSKP